MKVKLALIAIPLIGLLILYYLIKSPTLVFGKNMSIISADSSLLQRHVVALAMQSLPRSVEFPEGLKKAANYIQNEWQKQGWVVNKQPFSDADHQFENLIISYQPDKKERIVVGAHYDVCGPYPGADDNASGVAGLLESTRLIKEHKPNLPYRIDFVAFSTEEPHYFRAQLMGSYVH
ncbi:MAG: M28 family peptidase, partial [Bacteroidetes bacterium]|nr:M28 family peptidase [Bacteroidota bacterium]